MFSQALTPNVGLLHARRLASKGMISDRPTWEEYCLLFSCGMVAALTVGLLEFKLRIPGHAILRAVLPLVAGLAMVPRRGAGTAMSLSAGLTGIGLHLGHWGDLGAGSFTSLLATGPLLDLALRNVQKPSRWIYARVALVGLAANWLALAAKLTESALGKALVKGRPWQQFLPRAFITYSICGILAGLISAVIVFRARASAAARESQVDDVESQHSL